MHIPVLLQEVVNGLAPQKGDIILDATVGGGGHTEALCKAVGGDATFICLDADADAIERSRSRFAKAPCVFNFYRTNFRRLDEALKARGIKRVNCALFDLGLSSEQLDESGRGFSFRGNELLQMTFEKIPPPSGTPFTKGRIPEGTLTAEKIVNEWDEENLSTIIGSYGEERAAKRIVAAIVRARAVRPIATTAELRDIIERAVPRRGKLHPATKTFQALRMTVNDELGALEEGLRKAWDALAEGGRLAVISFHSLEDRLVKRFFRTVAKEGSGTFITKKPITPTREEAQANPRARSAKLRIIEKL